MINFLSDKELDSCDLCLPFWEGKQSTTIAAHGGDFDVEIRSALKTGDFLGKEGELLSLYSGRRLILLGLGVKEKVCAETLRRAFASLSKFCKEKKLTNINLVFPKGVSLEYQKAILEGLLLASYSFDHYKSEKAQLLKKVGVAGARADLKKHLKGMIIVRDAVFLTRDLVSSNADTVTPRYLASLAERFEKDLPKVKTKILTKKQLEKEGCGLLLAVAKGSCIDPVLIIMEYRGLPKSKDKSVIVGKGVTFDTGGLNVKPTGGIEDMRCDMAGAATCFGTIYAAAHLGLKVNLTAVIPATENAIGSKAFKPGDVHKSCLGKTVEIGNTDAEGRLILADALAYANKHLQPSRLIDLATLTGAMIIALGEEMAGIFTNNENLGKKLQEASSKTSERIYPFPLYPDYLSLLKSEVADLRNHGGRPGGSITAALFLQEFVGKTPWAHIDIAGPAFYSKERAYIPKNGTGFGVRLLIDYLENK